MHNLQIASRTIWYDKGSQLRNSKLPAGLKKKTARPDDATHNQAYGRIFSPLASPFRAILVPPRAISDQGVPDTFWGGLSTPTCHKRYGGASELQNRRRQGRA